MRPRGGLVGAIAAGVVAALAVHALLGAMVGGWLAVGVHPDVTEALERSRDDVRHLARLEPEREGELRARFDELETLVRRLRVLEHSRDRVARRYELVLLGVVGLTAALVAGFGVWRRARLEARLERLGVALASLADGRTDVEVGDRGRDLVGRIAAMVEETSRRMASDRRRLRSLRNLSAWQESARRHAHEIRTPLTAARLELARLAELLGRRAGEGEEPARVVASALQELDRLSRFTAGFTSFARLPRPEPRPQDLVALLGELAATFAEAWPNLLLRVEPSPGPVVAAVDADLFRQVVVNLCDNSSLALMPNRGTVRLSAVEIADGAAVEVADDGPGIAEEVRRRLFEPYTTTRGIGEGMGLGLAISKKILLDHGGDLELVATGPGGTTFRLSLPREPDAEP